MKLYRIIPTLVLTALMAVSCIEDDSAPVVNTENPFALTATSDVTLQLKALANNELDCLGMNYPITVATYLEGFVVDQSFTFTNSTELLAFINNLSEGETYAIHFPFSITGNGEDIDIISNSAFLQTLIAEADACCITTNTEFSQQYNSITANEIFSMDTFTHEYTFSVNQPGKICSIGYKGEADELEYLVEIVNDQNTVIYTGTHTFTSTEIEYISIPQVSLEANKNYTIRRSIEAYGPNSMGIGTIKIGSAAVLPVTLGHITVHQARFYGGGGSEDPAYDMIPNIDFVFKPQAE